MNFQFPDDKEERVPKVKIPHEQEPLKLTIAATDKAIDALVYELHGHTRDEIRIVEGESNE